MLAGAAHTWSISLPFTPWPLFMPLAMSKVCDGWFRVHGYWGRNSKKTVRVRIGQKEVRWCHILPNTWTPERKLWVVSGSCLSSVSLLQNLQITSKLYTFLCYKQTCPWIPITYLGGGAFGQWGEKFQPLQPKCSSLVYICKRTLQCLGKEKQVTFSGPLDMVAPGMFNLQRHNYKCVLPSPWHLANGRWYHVIKIVPCH